MRTSAESEWQPADSLSGRKCAAAGLIVFAIASAIAYQLFFGRHPMVRGGEILSALTPAQRARQSAAQQPAPPVPKTRLDEMPTP